MTEEEEEGEAENEKGKGEGRFERVWKNPATYIKKEKGEEKKNL